MGILSLAVSSLIVYVDYFRILGALVPKKHVPKVLFSVLGISWGLNPSRGQAKAMERMAVVRREGTGEQICPAGENVLFSLVARWAELPVSRARFQHRKVSKLRREERNCESDSQTACSLLAVD